MQIEQGQPHNSERDNTELWRRVVGGTAIVGIIGSCAFLLSEKPGDDTPVPPQNVCEQIDNQNC